MPDAIPAAPDLQPNLSDPAAAPITTSAAGPAPPPKETFGQGFRRGATGEQYVVDAEGNVGSARRTADSTKGRFGSILAGAVMGALAGAHSARPGGIPSHELSGGAGKGAEAAADMLRNRDVRNRGVAQQDFENRNTATEAKNKDLMYKAQIHIASLNEIKTAHEIGEAERNDPIRHQQLVNAANLSAIEIDAQAKNLGLINERSYKDYADVPKSDIDKFNRHEVMLITQGDGSVKVWDRTFDARTQPNSADFEVRDLVSLDEKGKPEWKTTGTVKAGKGTAAQQEAQIVKERQQLNDAAEKNATIAKEKSETAKNYSTVALNNAQVKLMQSMGVNVPPGYKPPDNTFKMSSTDARQAITQSGVQVPPDFESMYAIGHYKGDLKTLTTNPRKGMPVRDQNSALTYIRTFINPNYDVNNFTAVKKLETEFASSQPNTPGGNLLSFNAAIGHLGQLYKASQALSKSDLPALNLMANGLNTATGKDPQKVYDGIRAVLAGEAGRLFKQGVPDVAEMKAINDSLASASSPEQFKGVIGAYAHAFLTKGEQSIWKYYDYTGELPASTFNPNTAKTLRDLGIDISQSLPQGAQTQNTGNQNPQQNPNKPTAIPAPVASALANVGPGRHTLSDNTIWDKAADGTITQVKAP